MKFLLILFLVFLAWTLMPLVRGLWRFNRQRKQWQQFFRHATGAEQGFASRSGSRAGSQGATPRKKVFTREDGEYVDFEEITLTEEEQAARNSTSSDTASTVRESRVTDAEWEEIN